LRSIIGKRAIIPHIIIQRVCVIGEFGAITGGMLRHLLVFVGHTFVEELLIMVG